MACCDWSTFKDSFLAAWLKKGAGELLIDWPRAQKDWRRHHCTGGESASMQLQSLARESEYLWIEQLNARGKGEWRRRGRRTISLLRLTTEDEK